MFGPQPAPVADADYVMENAPRPHSAKPQACHIGCTQDRVQSLVSAARSFTQRVPQCTGFTPHRLYGESSVWSPLPRRARSAPRSSRPMSMPGPFVRLTRAYEKGQTECSHLDIPTRMTHTISMRDRSTWRQSETHSPLLVSRPFPRRRRDFEFSRLYRALAL